MNSIEKHTLRMEVKKIIVCFFVSYLFNYSTAADFWAMDRRLYMHWQRSDTAAVFLAIAICAAIFYLAYSVISRQGRYGRMLAEMLFVFVTLFYFKINMVEVLGVRDLAMTGALHVALHLVVALAILAYIIFREKMVYVVRVLCKIYSPILIVYAVILLNHQPVKTNYQPVHAQTPIIAVKPVKSISKVCVIIFDSWAYSRIFRDREIDRAYPNISKLASMSYVFHQAYSPAKSTKHSLPSLLSGVKGESVLMENEELLFKSTVGAKKLDDYEHIFKRMKALGYSTELTGYYLPYPEMISTGVDSGRSWSYYKYLGDGVLANTGILLLNAISLRISFIWGVEKALSMIKNNYFAELAVNIHIDCLKMLSSAGKRFGFYHYSVPHEPSIFERTGAADCQLPSRDYTIKGYEGNLEYVDTLVGNVLKTIASTSDGTMLIVTSDHSWKYDPCYQYDPSLGAREIQHVPMFVHLPGQTKREDVDQRFENVNTGMLIYKYLSSDANVMDIINEF